jgi:protocatechuate 4,5-dioxygenase alpha chain
MIFDLFIFGNGDSILRPDLRQPTPRRRLTVSLTIPGTTPFDGGMAQKGYALNKMCFSFNHKENRDAFVADPEAYMRQYGLNPQQAEAIRSKQVLALLEAGGNAYYLAKFAGIFGLDMQDIGAQQTGMTKDEFKAKLVAANEQC